MSSHELDELYADGSEVSFQALRQIPKLEAVLKETLRLHPPLIILMRVAQGEFEVCGLPDRARATWSAATPAISNRIAEDFPNPDTLRSRPLYRPATRKTSSTAGRGFRSAPAGTAASGAAFALMQLKAIFSILLRDWEFEMAQPSETYRNDHSKMVVQLQQPCTVRYRKRSM